MNLKQYILIFILVLNFLISNNDIDEDSKNCEKNKDPSIAWKLSFLPGLGQIYNKDYLKGFLIFSSEVILLKNASIATNLTTRNSYIWWAIGIYVLNIIDAYVEAELSTFSEDKKNKD